MCALQGWLPRQGYNVIAFATAPRDMQLEWWTDSTSHPAYTYPCLGAWCDPEGFTIGDVLFAEVAVTYALCRNRADLFELDEEELFMCDLDTDAYRDLAARFEGMFELRDFEGHSGRDFS